MQPNFHPRRRALVSIAALLLGGATSGLIAAPQGANLISVASLGTLTTASNNPRGDLLLASDGNLYASTFGGGTASVGAILQITPAGVITNLHSMAGATTEGASSYAALIEANDGNLYGTTYVGGTKSVDTVFKVTKTGTYTNLFSFDSASKGGFLPYTGLVQAPDGDLYGTTLRGGDADKGTVYRITLAGSLSIIHSFNGSDGVSPEGGLIVGPDGALYGTTLLGGAADRGTVYKITTSGTLTTVYSFEALGAFTADGVATNADGANPRASLTLSTDGNFYGTSYQGGTGGFGTVFRMTPAGAITTLHAFTGPPLGGANPLARVFQDTDGSLYGTTEKGGSSSKGVAWRISPTGEFQILHSFVGTQIDGATSYTTLQPLNGFLYGAAYTDSVTGAGAIFKLDLGSGGVLPVTFSVSPETIQLGASATLTYASPTASACTASGAWTDTITTSGTKALTPTTAGIYTYALACTDGAGVIRNAYTSLVITAPAAEPVDGGGDGGGGAFTLLGLALLGGATLVSSLRRSRTHTNRLHEETPGS